MAKAPAKASDGLAKRFILGSMRVLGAISLFAWVIASTVFVYAMLTKAAVEVKFDGGIPSIKATPQVDKPPPVLSNSFQAQSPSIQGVVEISRLPEPLRGRPDEVVDKIGDLWQTHQTRCNSVWHCCYIISLEIAMKVSIDTAQIVQDASVKQVYRCIQICLNAIDYYGGQIDGDAARTKEAVEKFQKGNDLEVDGKVGRATWHAILIALAHKNYGSTPKESGVVLARREN
jgi:hypothetical protein